MKKNIISMIFSMLLISIAGYSQSPTDAGRPDPANMPLDAKVTGVIMDASTNQPVEYASVALYRTKDSTLVGGVVSDPAGKFSITGLPYGKFYAQITFIGYKKLKVDNILLVPNQKTGNLGTVKLEASSTALKEVEVVGNSAQMEYKIDKKIVNVSQNIIASGGTVVDALQNTPSVQTDLEGNVTLRGSSSFTVLIDGKPSVVKGSDALQQIPASLVQSIEIITNPSAKYDAEGSAGIINVIMKKQKIKGFNGTVTLSAGTNHKNNDNFMLNYKYSKLNFSIGADFTDMAFKMNNNTERKYFTDGELTKYQLMDASGQFNRKGKGIKGGIDYAITDKSTITFGGRIGDRSFSRPFNSFYTDYFPVENKTIYYISNSSGYSKDNFYSMNLDYMLNLNSKGHQLSATVYYSGSKENDPSNMWQDTTDMFYNPIQERYSQNIIESGDEKEFRFKTDYTLPIGEKGKFETGFQSRMQNNVASHHLYNNEVENHAQQDELNFKDNIHSGYVTYSNSLKLFDYQLGLRAEKENREVTQKNMNQDTSVKRIDFFPTIHLSKQLPWGLQLQASYTRRINRPNNWSLSPLKRYMDPQNVRVGNPGLLPEFTDAYELNIQKKITDASFISAEGFYRKTDNPMQMDLRVENGVNIMTMRNLGKDESLGVEFMLNAALTKKWNVNVSSSVYNYKLTGAMENTDSKSNTNWNIRGNTMYRFKTGTSLQLNGMYNAPTITAQGTRGAFFTTGLAIRQELFKNKASLTLQARDILGEMKMKMTSQTSNFYSYSIMKRETKVFTLTFTYRINNYKQQSKRQEEMSSGDQGGDQGGMQ